MSSSQLDDQQYSLLTVNPSLQHDQRRPEHTNRSQTNVKFQFITILVLFSFTAAWVGLTQQSEQQPRLQSMVHVQVHVPVQLPVHVRQSGLDRDNLKSQCKEFYFSQQLDNFNSHKAGTKGQDQYMQRYFVCDQYWTNTKTDTDTDTNVKTTSKPIFFYVGNEANVELYLNQTGLMWENAPAFEAMLVFAEHRYFGQSIPTQTVGSTGSKLNMDYLSSEQALADYANLIRYLKNEQFNCPNSPVIAFGGSYGGMLASWFRMKYPHIIDGAIAGSAPILSFPGENPPIDPTGYDKVITFDASPGAGAAPNCASNIRKAWDVMMTLGSTSQGRTQIQQIFSLCAEIDSLATIKTLMEWIKDAYSSMAMGNYPYASSYLLNGLGMLPAYPVREACEYLKDDFQNSNTLLSGLSQSISIFYNATGNKQCYDLGQAPNNASQQDGDFWGYLYCTEMCMPFSSTGISDMFWPETQNWTETTQQCQEQWGVTPRLQWAQTMYGGTKALETASNIVFSNGNYDPWSAYGVLHSYNNPSIVTVMIDGGAHHLDFMFSHPLDPPSVIAARNIELGEISKWIAQSRKNLQMRV